MSVANAKALKIIHLSEIREGRKPEPGYLIPHPELPIVAAVVAPQIFAAFRGDEMWPTRKIAASGSYLEEDEARSVFPELAGYQYAADQL